MAGRLYSVLLIGAWATGFAAAQTGPPDAGWGADRLAAAVRGKDTAVAVAAAQALGELTEDAAAAAALNEAVINGKLEAEVRVAAVAALARAGDERAVESLLAVLGDDNVRWPAADALLAFNSEAVAAKLVAILSGDRDGKRRAGAAYALGRARPGAALEPLRKALRDEEPEVRVRACAAVAAYGDRTAVEPLIINLATDTDWRGRRAAADALGVLGDGRAVTGLAARLDDRRPEVRAAAAASLAAIGDMRAMDPLRARAKKERDGAARAAMETALQTLKTTVLSDIKP